MKAVLAIMIVAVAVGSARADTDLVVLGPAAADGMRASIVSDVKQAVDKAALGKRGTDIGPSCAVDVACLKATGSDLAAQRVIAIAIAPSGKNVAVDLVLFDVGADEVIGKRSLSLGEKKIERELAAMLRTFIDEATVERAKELFAKGNKHYNLNELEPALVAYKRAYQVKPLAEFQFNIAQCHRKLGQHKEAIAMYQQYLVGVPNAENRPLVEDLIKESKSALDERDHRDSEQKRAEELRRAREAEALAAKEKRRTAEAKKSKVLPWVAVGIGAAALVAGGLLYATSETDDGTQPTYRDTRPAGLGVGIGGGVLVSTGFVWLIAF